MARFPNTSLFRRLTVAVFAIAISGPAIAQQHDKFMKRSATAEEWVDALKANPMGRTRGIVMDGPSKAPPKPSAQALISFQFNSAVLTPDAKRQLDSLAAALTTDALKADRFRVEGHTDAVGSESYNLELSKRRAGAVKQYLMRQGSLPADKLRSVGKGESDLFDKSNPDAAVNRRVVITNLGQ